MSWKTIGQVASANRLTTKTLSITRAWWC